MVTDTPDLFADYTVSTNSVSRKASEEGIPCAQKNNSPGRPWTPEDDAFLEQNLPRHAVYWIARKLHRSRRAVQRRIARLRLRKLDDSQGYTISDLVLAGIAGTYRTCVRWINLGWLVAERRHSDHPRDFWLISPKNLRAFIAKYPQQIDLAIVQRRCGEMFLFDLLMGTTHGAGQFGRTDEEIERDLAELEAAAEGDEE